MRLQLETRALDALTLPEAQSKRHDETDIGRIAASITRFGFNDPIGILPDGRIVEGVGRLMAAAQLGMTHVPVLVLHGVSDRQADLYRIAHNKITLTGTFDFEKLATEMVAVMGDDISFEQLGFGEDHADNILRMFTGGSASMTRAVDLSYEIVWDDAEQRKVWERFIKGQRLAQGGDIETTSGTLALRAISSAALAGAETEEHTHVRA